MYTAIYRNPEAVVDLRVYSPAFLRCPESPRPLLVHLSPGGHSINGHVEKATGADDVEDTVNVLKDGHHHLILILRGWPDKGIAS